MRAAWVLIVVAACSREVAGGKADGAAVFAQACSSCHGPNGSPTEALRAQLGVRDLTTPEFHARVTADLVRKQVKNGSANHVMPSFDGALSDAQIDAVAAYVLTLSAPKK